MRWWLIPIACILFAVVAFIAPNIEHPTFFDRVIESVVYIESNIGWSGSGVVIREDGFILTAGHVIEDANDFTIIFANGDEYKAVDWGYAEDNDLGWIKIEGHFKALPLAEAYEYDIGHTVFVCGGPLGYEFYPSITKGIISGIQRFDGYDGVYDGLMQIDAAVYGGNSGGPVVSDDGKVIGIVVLAMNYYDNFNFAVPIEQVLEFLESIKYASA